MTRTIDELSKQIAFNLRHLRRVRGKTLTEVSRATGINRISLHHYETNKSKINAANLFKLAEYYDMAIEYFIQGKVLC